MTGEKDRLLEWFDSGVLVRPGPGAASFVDLLAALFAHAGAEPAATTPDAERLGRLIGPAEHYLFVLVDGMGANLVEALPGDGFLRRHLVEPLRSVYFSTTAAALTTLATGLWPGRHGVPGWWTYLPRRHLSVVSLRFCQRHTDRPAEEFGLTAEELYPVASVWPLLGHRPATIVPKALPESVYSRYASGGTPRVGYDQLDDGLALAAQQVQAADRASLTYLYLPQLDGLMHHHGPQAPKVGRMLAEIDSALGELARRVAGKARIVITADHGQVHCPPERRFLVAPDDPLAAALRCQPVGEPGVPIFHVRPGREAAFAEQFTARFGEHFALLTTEEIDELGLLGPGPMSEVTRRRMGSFVGIAPRAAKLYVEPADANVAQLGIHGGLTPEEVRIPLILA